MFVLSVIGILAIVFSLILYGMHLGLQFAVDKSKRDGFFYAYGKKFKVVEYIKND